METPIYTYRLIQKSPFYYISVYRNGTIILDGVENNLSEVTDSKDFAKASLIPKAISAISSFGSASVRSESKYFKKMSDADSPSSFQNSVNKVKELKDKSLDDFKKKAKDAKEAAAAKYAYLKKEINSKVSINAAVALFTPIVKKLLRELFSIEKIKNKLIQFVKDELKKKGKVEIKGKKIIFTPNKQDPSYKQFANSFNNQVNSLRTGLTSVQLAVNSLNNVLNVLNTVSAAISVYIVVKKIILEIKLKKILVELALPTPSKPTAGTDLNSVITGLDKISKLEDKLKIYQLSIASLSIIITVIKAKIDTILSAINGLELIIVGAKDQPNNPQVDDNLVNKLSEFQGNPDSDKNNLNITKTFTANDGKTYHFIIERLDNKTYRAVAIDTFSGLKITQTAPSKFIKPNDLFIELTQILNI